MRKFSSYGPLDTDLHYYAPRQALIAQATDLLLGDDPAKSGQYLTVWAPRQSGKTWIMQQVARQIQSRGDFEVLLTTMQFAQSVTTVAEALQVFVESLRIRLDRDFPTITQMSELRTLFTDRYFAKPLILILDEFDALRGDLINHFANEFRGIYTERQAQAERSTADNDYRLHGLALIGVRAVLGIENVSGSPFNVQRSLHIPNLTHAEVNQLFAAYASEHDQPIAQGVIDRIYGETQGQPGLVSWFGELLTDRYNRQPSAPLTMDTFAEVWLWATSGLPNNNIQHLISKADQLPYRDLVLRLYKTDQPMLFSYDDALLNFLYLNGVIDIAQSEDKLLVKFANPFVQKRLFNYFAREIFPDLGTLHDPFTDLSDTITETALDVKRLLQRYASYLQNTATQLFRNAPRRVTDLRIYEAVYHFNLYRYLSEFLERYDGRVIPEFPTGNGKVDLLIHHAGQLYALELKSFTSRRDYQKALVQAAHYAHQLGLVEITLVLFIEQVDEGNRRTFEHLYTDSTTGVTVVPLFVVTAV